jgi:quercetin dioxygenase-like cupin family protein
MIQRKINFRKMEWEQPMEGMKQKVYCVGKKQIRLVQYRKQMLPHWCEKGHYGMILYGNFQVEYNNQTLNYRQGDGIFIPEGSEHRHRAKVNSDYVEALFVEDL